MNAQRIQLHPIYNLQGLLILALACRLKPCLALCDIERCPDVYFFIGYLAGYVRDIHEWVADTWILPSYGTWRLRTVAPLSWNKNHLCSLHRIITWLLSDCFTLESPVLVALSDGFALIQSTQINPKPSVTPFYDKSESSALQSAALGAYGQRRALLCHYSRDVIVWVSSSWRTGEFGFCIKEAACSIYFMIRMPFFRQN